MVHGSVNVADAGGWAYAPGDFSVMDPDWCGFASGHEIGHNWGQGHYNSVRDYTGDNFWHITMTGSGFGHSTRDVQTALNLRRNQWKGGIEWVEYNAELPPHASPDLVTTKTNTPVSVNVLLNDYIGNSNTLSIASFETNTAAGGVVTNLGSGVLRYTPANNFVGYDLFRYYVAEPSGLKSHQRRQSAARPVAVERNQRQQRHRDDWHRLRRHAERLRKFRVRFRARHWRRHGAAPRRFRLHSFQGHVV
jgi:hypothetical protein